MTKNTELTYEQLCHAAEQLSILDRYFQYDLRRMAGICESLTIIGKTPNAVISPEAIKGFEKAVRKVHHKLRDYLERAFDPEANDSSDFDDDMPY